MFSSISIPFSSNRQGAASLARERLINDKAMRRNHALRDADIQLVSPPITYTFNELPDWLDNQTVVETHLSPAEQQRQAIMICKTFREHYLSKLIYLQDEQIALAIIQPSGIGRQAEGPLQIIVDNRGNTRVTSHREVLSQPVPRLAPRRLLLMGSVLMALASSLMLILT